MTEEHRSDGRSIDEILAEARAELDKTPDEPQQAAEPGTPEPDDFTPDFGHTFDDYGEFEEPQPEEELPPEPPRKRHKRIVPLFVKIILYVVIVAVVSVGAGYAAWACATDVLAFGRSSDTIQVTVPENASLDAIADMLHENGLIRLRDGYLRLTRKGMVVSNAILTNLFARTREVLHTPLPQGAAPQAVGTTQQTPEPDVRPVRWPSA